MRSVVASAPVRVADVGGWTDTWFGSPGRVCHLAVGPGVVVEAGLVERAVGRPVVLHAVDLGPAYAVGPSAEHGWDRPEPSRHPLLEHAIGAVLGAAPLPPGSGVDITIRSAVPPGASLGTSAAVVVALLGALDRLVGGDLGRSRSPGELAALAHEVETARAGREAGVQDQWAAALGGCGLIDVDPYPTVRHRPIDLAAPTVDELGRRLVTVVFGRHDSSAVHGRVIGSVTGGGGPAREAARAALGRLAGLAADAAEALAAGDLGRWAETLTAATRAQAALHPDLVGPPHRRAIEMARAGGATGWKVNGAGGAGGSLTVLAADGGGPALAAALAATDPTWRVVDLRPAGGLVVAEGPAR